MVMVAVDGRYVVYVVVIVAVYAPVPLTEVSIMRNRPRAGGV